MQPAIPDSGGERIQRANAEFLLHLTGQETVNVDPQGRLYTVSGIRSLGLKIGNIFKRSHELDQAVNTSIKTCLTQKKMEWQQGSPTPQTVRTFYDNLIAKLSSTRLLSNTDKELLLRDKYDQIYRAILSSGKPPFVAESMVTIEMSQDPLVPEAIKRRVQPELTKSGVNGTYIIKNRQGENIGIFKPSDEEVNMPNNPRIKASEAESYDQAQPKRLGPYEGHVQGTGWIKEVAAYSISKHLGGIDVPPTVKLSVPFPERQGSQRMITKEGSLQQFVAGEALEKRKYEDVMKIPPNEIQKIVLFDLLIGNADRNLGNCFIRGTGSESHLIPIDHGFSFLDSLFSQGAKTETNCHLATLPQLQEPCELELIASVLSLTPNAVKGIATNLQEKGTPFSENSLKEFKTRLMLMQVALKEGYSLSQITPMLMFSGTTPPLIETLAKSRDIDDLLDQWDLAEGDLSRLNSILGTRIEKWAQIYEENLKKEDEL
jgi:Phosphatidylinositol 3- and 4-kinase